MTVPWHKQTGKQHSHLRYAYIAVGFLVLFSIFVYHVAFLAAEQYGHGEADTEFLGMHPIVRLHLRAKKDHDAFLSRQSRRLNDSIATYRQHYNVSPPAGFEAWFNKAIELKSPIIDDFDELFAQVKTFVGRPLNSSAPTAHLESLHLLRICVEQHTLKFEGSIEPWFVAAVESMLTDALDHLPDMCVYMNTLDEPRSILLPYDAAATDEAIRAHDRSGVSFFSASEHSSTFSEVTLPCLLNSSHTVHYGEQHPRSNFAESFEDVTDLCNYDRSLAFGFITSPESASMTHDPVPILSNAKMSTFSDILFPSIWRYEHISEGNDIVAWENKSDTLYWRGSTTGGHGSDGGTWGNMHRQSLIANLNSSFPLSNHSIMPDVAFTKVIQCDEDACAAEEAALPMADRASPTKAHAHKFVLDVDGNGLSGRLYDLLGSNSVVVRQTMLREWHDERLRAWLHYVPLRPGAPEAGELLEFFGTEEGMGVAKDIAEEGRRWKERALRRVDQSLYMWRLFLELAGERMTDQDMMKSAVHTG